MAVVADIDFDAGNLDELDAIVPTGTVDIQAQINAALGQTSYGMRVEIDDTTSRYGRVDFTPGATDFRARVYVDPNSLAMGSSEEFTILSFTGASGIVAHVILNWNGSTFRLRLRSLEDGGGATYTYVTITDAAHYVEVHVKRGAGTGENKMWVDGTLQATHSSLDNDAVYDDVSTCYLGALYLDSGTSGTLYLDELIIRDDDTAIGPNSTTTSSTTGGTTTTGASTTTLSGSGSTSTVTISSTDTTTTTDTTTDTTTTGTTTTTYPPTTIRLRDGPGGHAARASIGDRLLLSFRGAGGDVEEVWVEVKSVTDPGSQYTYYEYSVERKAGNSVEIPAGVTAIVFGPSGGGLLRLVGEDS